MPAAGSTPVMETVIINNNAGDALERCVSAVFAQPIDTRVTVVDNASTDDSLDHLRASTVDSQDLEILVNEANLGFAKAVNRAVNRLEGAAPYLLILNPDCEVLPGSIAKLANALDANADDFLILAKKVPEQIKKRVMERPDAFRKFADLDDDKLDDLLEKLDNG